MKKWFKSLKKYFKLKISIKNDLQDASQKSNIINHNIKKLKDGKRN